MINLDFVSNLASKVFQLFVFKPIKWLVTKIYQRTIGEKLEAKRIARMQDKKAQIGQSKKRNKTAEESE